MGILSKRVDVNSETSVYVPSPFINLKKVGVYYRGGKLGSTNHKIINEDTGEISEIMVKGSGSFEITDSLEYVKLYNGIIDIVGGFSISGFRCFLYVIEYLPKGADYIKIESEVLRMFGGYKNTRNAIVGISEMIKGGILAKRSGDEYWVNPNYIFKGSRKGLLSLPNRVHIHSALIENLTKSNESIDKGEKSKKEE
jgi:Firmicute plasmid replication protein (RepL)